MHYIYIHHPLLYARRLLELFLATINVCGRQRGALTTPKGVYIFEQRYIYIYNMYV